MTLKIKGCGIVALESLGELSPTGTRTTIRQAEEQGNLEPLEKSNDMRMLEAAATAAAEAAARSATTAKAGSARAARRRGHGASGLHRHHIQIAHQQVGHEAASVRTLIPTRRLHGDTRERLHPFFFHVQRHRVGQVLLEKFRSLLQ